VIVVPTLRQYVIVVLTAHCEPVHCAYVIVDLTTTHCVPVTDLIVLPPAIHCVPVL